MSAYARKAGTFPLAYIFLIKSNSWCVRYLQFNLRDPGVYFAALETYETQWYTYVMQEVKPSGAMAQRQGTRAKLSEDRKRAQVCVRVCPDTKRFLEALHFKNIGRAMDALVRAVQRREIREMIDRGEPLKIREIV